MSFASFLTKWYKKNTLRSPQKRKSHRERTMSKAEVFVKLIYGKLVGDKGYIRKRLFERLLVNMHGSLATYCWFPKKPCVNLQREWDTKLKLF